MSGAHPTRVAAYGTGLLRTEIHALPAPGAGPVAAPGAGFHWSRVPGPLAPVGFQPLADELVAQLGELTGSAATRLVLGQVRGTAREYRVGGAESLAARLLRTGPDAEAARALRELGALLARLHGLRPPAVVPAGPPAGLRRLADWLAAAPTGGHAAPLGPVAEGTGAPRAGLLLRERLGERRLGRLRRWCAAAAADGQRAVLVHGAPSLGAAVLGPGGSVELLTGEDLCRAPWYLDLGWLTGELVELAWQQGGDHRRWQSLLTALTAGYGADLGDRWHRAAALRTALHLHDFSAYVAWDPAVALRYAAFLGFLIDQRPTLVRASGEES